MVVAALLVVGQPASPRGVVRLGVAHSRMDSNQQWHKRRDHRRQRQEARHPVLAQAAGPRLWSRQCQEARHPNLAQAAGPRLWSRQCQEARHPNLAQAAGPRLWSRQCQEARHPNLAQAAGPRLWSRQCQEARQLRLLHRRREHPAARLVHRQPLRRARLSLRAVFRSRPWGSCWGSRSHSAACW